jgi:hypothetical protein
MRGFLIVLALCAPPLSARAADLGPLAPAAEGKVQCYQPNEVAKTCQSIGSYRIGPGGEIENTASMMISTSPQVVMTTRAPAVIKAGKDCGVLKAEHIDASTFVVEGKPADAAQTAALRAQMKGALRSVIGHEVCSAYLPNGAALMATSTIDGMANPSLDQKVIWVSPAEGYKVAP